MSIQLKKGVHLHVVPTEKYKTIRVMIRFSTKLDPRTITKRTLLSSLMETNSLNYSDQVQLSEKLADLYGASFGIGIGKKGNEHQLTVSLNIVNEKYLPNSHSVLAEAVDFLKEIIFQPNIVGNQFEQETFTREQANLIEYIDSVFDDKQSYASLALQALYFSESAAQKIPSFGTTEEVEKETATSLATYYQEFITQDLVDILVIGDVQPAEMVSLFSGLPFEDRGDAWKKSEFYEQKQSTIIKEKVDVQPVAQSKLNIAYHSGIYYHGESYFALQVFNGLFGGFPHSKLFMNVREKESMAYYASSSIDTFRGMMTVQTGIDGKNREKVLALIAEQLISLMEGNVTEEELAQTKAMLKNQYLLSLDNSSAVLEKLYLNTQYPNGQLTDKEWLEAVDGVTIKEVQQVAAQIKLQAVYFMEGEEA